MLRAEKFEWGPEANTFTTLGRCPRTGRLGVAITTAEMAVAGRCVYVKSNVAAVASQARTNPLLGPLALQLVELGYPASRVMLELEASDPYIEFRQIGIVDRWGHVSVRTGTSNGDYHGSITGDGWIAMANGVVGEEVIQAMAGAMDGTESEDLEVRLVNAIEAGTNAGGQPTGQRSAGVVVYENEGFSIVNLRVDDSDAPMKDLRALFDKFHTLMRYYKERPFDPRIGNQREWAEENLK